MIGKQCFLCYSHVLTLDSPEGEGGTGGEGTDPPVILCLRCQGKVHDKKSTSEKIRNEKRKRRNYVVPCCELHVKMAILLQFY